MKTTRHIAEFETFETRNLMSASVHVGTEPTKPEHSEEHHTAVKAPAKPNDLKAAVAAAGVTLTWKDKSTTEAGFNVFRLNATTHALVQVGTVAANATTFTDTTPTSGTNVYVVRAFNDAGTSEGSNAVTVKVADPLAVTAPNRLTSKALSTTSISLTWAGDKGATGGFIIQRSATGKDGWLTVGATNATTHTFTDVGLTAGTRYAYRIIAVGANDRTVTSATLIGQTKVKDSGDVKKTDDAKKSADDAAKKTEGTVKK